MNTAANIQSASALDPAWLLGGPGTQGAGLAATDGAVTSASMVQSRSAEIALETTEGDRVTLSFNSQSEVTYQVYNAQGTLEGAAPSSLSTFTLSSGSEITIAIEGDISDAEKADIEKVMSVIEKMAKEFFSGEVDEAYSALSGMGKTGTIAGLSVSLESSQSFSVSTQNGAAENTGTGEAPATPPTLPDTQATANAQPATGATQSTAAAAPTPPAAPPTGTGAQPTVAPQPDNAAGAPTQAPTDQTGRITVDTTNGLVDSMASAVQGSGVDLSRTEKHILTLLSHLFDKLAADLGFGEDKHRVADLVKSELAGRLHEGKGHGSHGAEGHGKGHGRVHGHGHKR